MPFASSPPRVAPTTNYQKYQTGNPLVQRLIARFLDRIVALTTALAPRRIVDLGCGEGMVATALQRGLPFPFTYRGIERNPTAVALAREHMPELDVQLGDFLTLEPPGDGADLALCLEVLEHLPDPQSAVARLCGWTTRDLIVSVPWEPYFRLGSLLRGKYLRTLGNHPEHVQQFTPRSLERLLATQFDRVRIERSFPWLIGVAQHGSDPRRPVG